MTDAAHSQSLQTRLLLVVMGMVCSLWLAAATLTWIDTEHEVGELLDAHLSQAASLLVTQPLSDLSRIELPETPLLHEYQPKVVLQVWHQQRLVVRSATAPTQNLADTTQRGVSNIVIGGQAWRVFSAPGRDQHVVIHVAELDQARRDVLLASMRSVLWPLAGVLPLLALGIWWAVRQAVKPLRELGHAVAGRQPDASDPMTVQRVPREAQPLVQALNRLFHRVATLIQSERRFTADAAHELRTPLAAIRMQAQVAQGAIDDTERNTALAATLEGCDRATRLLDQLLQLARLEAEVQSTGVLKTALTPLTTDIRTVLTELTPAAHHKQQRLEWIAAHSPDTHPFMCPMPEALVLALLRNLVDNALRYSPAGASVRLSTFGKPDGSGALTVEDSGPGMASQQRQRLGQRFFRVLGTGQAGSGLGWSIVTRIGALYGLDIQADVSPALGGLRVTVQWPAPPAAEAQECG